MQEASWFKDWFSSPYYHILYFERNKDEAEAFVNNLIDYLKPMPNSFMLDVACGKGRHSYQLAKKGFDVTGIDISFESIAEAKKMECESLHFYQHDMRLPFWVNYFDYAFNFFTSFGYFNTRREHENAIRSIAQSIKVGGSFVLDYLNIHQVEKNFIPRYEREINGINFIISKWFDEKYFYKKITIEDEKLTEPLEFTEKVAKFSLGDFNDMFSFHRLLVKEVFGDYNFNPYDLNNSARLILIAEKF